jgi:hypothetical protein
MPKTVDKYDKERLDVLHKIFNILGINENNNKFLLHELDEDLKKQKLGKIDDGIKRRLKIINYPLKFVDKPSKSNERSIDYSLKDKLTNDLYKQFILILIEKAVE